MSASYNTRTSKGLSLVVCGEQPERPTVVGWSHQSKNDLISINDFSFQKHNNIKEVAGDANIRLVSGIAVSLSTSVQVQCEAEEHQKMRKESAATYIQTIFRGLLARRALRSLKGLARLQAVFRGHSVRKQGAITLGCIQALARLQARVRARHVRLARESQTEQQKARQQLLHDSRVREIEEGWCDSAGSVEQIIQTKLLQKQEAAAKRERAMAYALAHQRPTVVGWSHQSKNDLISINDFSFQKHNNIKEVAGDANIRLVSGIAVSLSMSVQVQCEAEEHQKMREESAATYIQTIFRGLLARRALRALKGFQRAFCEETGCNNTSMHSSFSETPSSGPGKTCTIGTGESNRTTKGSAATSA